MFVLHEETMNQYPDMAFYRGVFTEGGVSMRAMEYGVEAPYPIRTTLDLARQWKIVGFTRNLISQVVLFVFDSVLDTERKRSCEKCTE